MTTLDLGFSIHGLEKQHVRQGKYQAQPDAGTDRPRRQLLSATMKENQIHIYYRISCAKKTLWKRMWAISEWMWRTVLLCASTTEYTVEICVASVVRSWLDGVGLRVNGFQNWTSDTN